MKNESANSAEAILKLSLLGPPPLLEWEDATAYDELLAQISGSLKPIDSIEEIWLCEIVDLTWETHYGVRTAGGISFSEYHPNRAQGRIAQMTVRRGFHGD